MNFVGGAIASRVAHVGKASVAVTGDGATTRLADLYQAPPLRFLFPHSSASEPMSACLVNTSGGMVGGDVHEIEAEAGAGASLLVLSQAAEKVYRSDGADCSIKIDLRAGEGAWLEYLPQETILFEGARLVRRTRIDAAKSAKVLAGEMVAFGRAARDEIFTQGFLRDAIEFRRDGRLVWADALHLPDQPRRALDHQAGFAGACATALLIFQAPDIEAHRDVLRELEVPDGVGFGASVISGILVARWLAKDGLALRRHYGAAWSLLRSGAGGLSPRLPSLWHI